MMASKPDALWDMCKSSIMFSRMAMSLDIKQINKFVICQLKVSE